MHKILFTGPESTGKTRIARRLAAVYQDEWVPEYARQFLKELGRPYQEQDLLAIAKGQAAAEDRLAARARDWLFCDTGMLVLKIWSEYKYGRCHPYILEQLHQRQYSLVVLCGIDIPWTPDPQRENPDDREELYEIYKRELKALNQEYLELWGTEKERLQQLKGWLAGL